MTYKSLSVYLYQDIKQSTRGHSLMGAPRMRSSAKLTISRKTARQQHGKTVYQT
jgi:hypothetical protein